MPRLALIQAQTKSEFKANLEDTIKSIREVAKQGAQIVCTQELFCTPYFCQKEESNNFTLAETIPGPSTDILEKLAKELKIVIIASLFEKRQEGLYHNTCVVFDSDGTFLGKYRKMHIPDDPDYYEKYYFAPGDLGYKIFHTRFAKIGVLICWDQWFPEASRILSLAGAEIIFYPTAIGAQNSEKHSKENYENANHQFKAWQNIQIAHAIANGVYVCAINRVGVEGNINFWGQSFLCDPFGVILKSASSTHSENLMYDVDLDEIRKTRNAWPFFRDRRIDSYTKILDLGK